MLLTSYFSLVPRHPALKILSAFFDVMSPVALSSFVVLAVSAALAAAQVTGTFPPVPLASKHYDYPNVVSTVSPQ